MEDFLTLFGNADTLVQDRAAVDVHILFHTLVHGGVGGQLDRGDRLGAEYRAPSGGEADDIAAAGNLAGGRAGIRSEEHTSELQSRENLVCRLLNEKKKNIGND